DVGGSERRRERRFWLALQRGLLARREGCVCAALDLRGLLFGRQVAQRLLAELERPLGRGLGGLLLRFLLCHARPPFAGSRDPSRQPEYCHGVPWSREPRCRRCCRGTWSPWRSRWRPASASRSSWRAGPAASPRWRGRLA